MRASVAPPTLVALLFAAILAAVMSSVLAQMALPLALSIGFGLITLIVVVASNELALYLLIFSMLLSPQFVAGGLEGAAARGRGLTLRLDDFLTLLVGVAWLAKTSLYKELGLVFRTALNRPIACYTFAAIFATSVGMIAGRVRVMGGSFFVLKYIEYFIIYFMVINNLRERKQFERLLLALLATAAIVSAIGMLQIPGGGRVSAPFEGKDGEPNTFGGYLVLMLALVGGLFLTSDSLRQKSLLAFLAALMAFPLFFTLSRSSYLALVPMAGALFVWSDRKRFLAVLFAMFLVVVPILTPKAVVDRILYTITQAPEEGQVQLGGIRLDTSTSERVVSWKQAVFQDWPRFPIFGWGITGYRFLDAQYPRVLAETGLVGLAAFLWLQVTLLRRTLEIYRRSRDQLFRGVSLGLLAGFVGLCVHAIGTNTFIIVRIMEPFWTLVGLVMMIPELERQPTPPVSEKASHAYLVGRATSVRAG